MLATGNDGHCTVKHHVDNSTHKGARRVSLCIESAFRNPTAADIASLAATDRPEYTALLMRRSADSRQCRLRATEGTLQPPDLAQFQTLLPHFRRKVIPMSDGRVQQSEYTSMLAADGSPKPMEWVKWQR